MARRSRPSARTSRGHVEAVVALRDAVLWVGPRVGLDVASLLITDFYEGGSAQVLVDRVKRLVAQGVTVLGLAAIDEQANPA